MPVASSFAAARDAVVSSVDQKFAEEIRLSPMKNKVADPGRPQQTILAVLRTGDEKGGPLDVNGAGSFNSKIAAGHAFLYVDRAVYPDIKLSKGDSLRAMTRPGKPVFEVATVNDRDHTRLIIGLNQV